MNENIKRPYDVVNSKHYEIGRLTVVQDTLLINEKTYPFTYVINKDSVCVLPIYEGKVIAINQYRHTLNKYMLELPCGGVDEGETAEQAARRELLEETGLIAGDLIHLGNYYMNQGISCAKCDLFFTKCKERSEANLEATELIEICEIEIDKFEEMVDNNEFKLLIGLTGWNKAKRMKLI